MYQRPPVRTYERKKAGTHFTTGIASTIIREDVPLSTDLSTSEDGNEVMIDDPFDTTFDRLLRTAKMPQKPPSEGSDSSYNSSSSSEEKAEEDTPLPLPLIQAEPVAKKRRVYSRKKVDIPDLTVATGGLKKLSKRPGRPKKSKSILDENTEPNVEQSEEISENERGKDKATGSKEETTKRQKVLGKRTSIAIYRGRKQRSPNNTSLARCSVKLSILDFPSDTSGEALSVRKDVSENATTKQAEEAAIPGTSRADENSDDRFAMTQDTSTEESAEKPGIVVDTIPTPNVEKRSEPFQNPIVCLTRLSVPQRFSVANKNWISSTPIDRRTIKKKTLLRLSPIDRNESMKMRVRHGDENSSEAILPPKSLVQALEQLPMDTTNPKLEEQSSKEAEERSAKRPEIVLSDSPAPEPSCLMFEDTEVPEHSYTAASPIETEKCKDTTDESKMSPFERSSIASSDPESLHLEYEAANKTGSSTEDLVQSVEETPSTAAEESSLVFEETHNNTFEASTTTRLKELTKDSSDAESIHLSLNDDDEDEYKEYSSKDLHHSVEDTHSASQDPTAPSENLVDITDASTNEQFKGSPGDSTNRTSGSAKNTTEKFDSDDEWITIPGSPEADARVSKEKNISVKNSSETSEPYRRESIEQLSSDDDNTSSDDIAELVNANEVSSSQMEAEMASREGTNSEDEKSVRVEDINGNESKAEGSPVVEAAHEKESRKDIRRNFAKPFVLLERLVLPFGTSKSIANVKNIRLQKSSDTTESGQNSTLSSADGSISGIETPVPVRMSRRPGKSVDPSDSLESARNSTPSSSLSEDGQTEESQKSDAEPEVNEKKSPSEKSSGVELDENDSHKDTCLGSVKPVVLLTRLNDPFRVSLRRRQKYSNTNFQLSVISENIGAKTAPIIEEAHEVNETPASCQSTGIIDGPSVKLSGEGIDSQQTTASVGTSILSNTMNESRFDEKEDRLLFLKPGKSWARSLSILSNIHSQEDLESLAVGKGKRWRESASNILQMQQQGLLQSCVKKNEDDKESRSFYGVRNSTAAWIPESSQSDTSRVFGTASPGRFVRRVSIRVVPDSKNFDDIEDTPFLEAYGITSSQNRKTIAERSASIASRKTLVYNVRDVRYDNIPKNTNSVTSRDVVLEQCCQETSLPFDECYPLSYLKHCRKIGEGVYGEVFLYEKGAEKNVIKIIPIEGELDVNNERQKKFDEILSEIVIAKELHNLRFADSSNTSSFVEVKNIRCVIGKYPQKLIDLWKTYDDEKNSENDCPAMFDKNQLYIVLELGHGGQDLEAFVFQNASESHALFMQAAVALAVAEEKLDFEHRDLHWGNILISRTEESHVEYKIRDKAVRLVSKGVKVAVIDFTLSRMSYQGCSIYNDLSMDEDLFSAQGEYQFEIYRLMRKKVENDWQRFEPFTNVLWLHYTLDKMITAVRYRRKNSKIHNTSIEKLRELKDTLLNYKSAFDFVTNYDKAT